MMQINTTNKTYDVLNSMVRYILPALGTLYFALSGIWGFPYAEQVLGTLVAFETFFGVIIFLAKRGWDAEGVAFDGDVLVDVREDGNDYLTVALDRPVEDVRTLENLNLKVVRDSQE